MKNLRDFANVLKVILLGIAAMMICHAVVMYFPVETGKSRTVYFEFHDDIGSPNNEFEVAFTHLGGVITDLRRIPYYLLEIHSAKNDKNFALTYKGNNRWAITCSNPEVFFENNKVYVRIIRKDDRDYYRFVSGYQGVLTSDFILSDTFTNIN